MEPCPGLWNVFRKDILEKTKWSFDDFSFASRFQEYFGSCYPGTRLDGLRVHKVPLQSFLRGLSSLGIFTSGSCWFSRFFFWKHSSSQLAPMAGASHLPPSRNPNYLVSFKSANSSFPVTQREFCVVCPRNLPKTTRALTVLHEHACASALDFVPPRHTEWLLGHIIPTVTEKKFCPPAPRDTKWQCSQATFLHSTPLALGIPSQTAESDNAPRLCGSHGT